MKVAIFGDSYGEKRLENPTDSWMDILSQNYTIDNFSVGGSSLYFSYTNFVQNHEKYDKIIFLITNFGRQWLKKCETIKHISGYATADFWSKQANNDRDRFLLEALKNYFLYIQDDGFEKTVHDLLVQKIRDIRKDSLLVPCYGDSLPEPTDNCLFYGCQKDWQYFNFEYTNEYDDSRHCHLNEMNNIIFAKELLYYLETNNFDIDRCVWVEDSHRPFGFYFQKRF